MSHPLALVTAVGGVGDILRVTPLIRVFAMLGYEVDVLLAPDYLETVKLLESAPEIRRLYYQPSPWSREQQGQTDGLDRQLYDVATFTVWSLPLRQCVRAQRMLAFQQAQWLEQGDIACVEGIARAIGWEGTLPAPFAIAASRQFGLPPQTVALHPGCKSGWPWKKWHGFAELAEMLPQVVIIGTEADLQNAGTYFGADFAWPARTHSYVGQLSLTETAALLRECAALVSNDSGLMHLGVALGIPTFGIFGLTSPQREMIPAPNMFAITKRLACEPACRRRPWGRRDCEYHLQCLRTLTAAEVWRRINEVVPLHLAEVVAVA